MTDRGTPTPIEAAPTQPESIPENPAAVLEQLDTATMTAALTWHRLIGDTKGAAVIEAALSGDLSAKSWLAASVAKLRELARVFGRTAVGVGHGA